MARIHRRAAGTWEVVLESGRDPKTGKRQRETFTVSGTKREAERVAAERTAAIARGTYVDPSRETVGGFLHRWLRDYVDVSISLRSRLRYRDIVEGVLVPHLGGVPIQQLKPAHILAMEQEVRKTGNRKTGAALAPASVRKIHNVLHRALRHAVAWQVIPMNPADAVDRPSVPGTPPRVLSPDEARRLLGALDANRFGLAIRTAMLCGLRLSELLGLRWADVDWAHGRLVLAQASTLATTAWSDSRRPRRTDRRGLCLSPRSCSPRCWTTSVSKTSRVVRRRPPGWTTTWCLRRMRVCRSRRDGFGSRSIASSTTTASRGFRSTGCATQWRP